MKSFNKVVIVGNLTKDPILKEFEGGLKLVNFTVATNRSWHGSSGEKVSHTDFHNIVVWRKLAEICFQYLKKGSAVLVEGQIVSSKFQNKDGKNIAKTEIVAEEVNFFSNIKQNLDLEKIQVVEEEVAA